MDLGAIIIKWTKNDVRWTPKIVKIGEIFMFYHLKSWQSWQVGTSHSYECQGIQKIYLFDKILR